MEDTIAPSSKIRKPSTRKMISHCQCLKGKLIKKSHQIQDNLKNSPYNLRCLNLQDPLSFMIISCKHLLPKHNLMILDFQTNQHYNFQVIIKKPFIKETLINHNFMVLNLMKCQQHHQLFRILLETRKNPHHQQRVIQLIMGLLLLKMQARDRIILIRASKLKLKSIRNHILYIIRRQQT